MNQVYLLSLEVQSALGVCHAFRVKGENHWGHKLQSQHTFIHVALQKHINMLSGKTLSDGHSIIPG